MILRPGRRAAQVSRGPGGPGGPGGPEVPGGPVLAAPSNPTVTFQQITPAPAGSASPATTATLPATPAAPRVPPVIPAGARPVPEPARRPDDENRPPATGAPPPNRRPRRRPSDPRNRVLTVLGVALALAGVLFIAVLGLRGNGDSGSATAAIDPRPVPGTEIAATASSTQNPEGGVTYGAENTLDGDPSTAWNSNGKVDGRGPGMSLVYTFDSPIDLHSITVFNGYQKTLSGKDGRTVDLFQLNSRVHEVRVVTDTGSWTWNLEDSRGAQTMNEDFGRTESVRLDVVSVYRSDKYLDLAVSEVQFSAR